MKKYQRFDDYLFDEEQSDSSNRKKHKREKEKSLADKRRKNRQPDFV
ncbi:hypothetical protein [Opacimonas viscosa]|uniref:Uncharacterized protein n=1 Tax=Opacimonas viscosa TaxID=2961944 RepID=A0AA41X1C7_9ALTE|nr:hypothetical protein [Opacimonas viscosa]MCP3428072.1 hypothetical protein [Opacimonas viscosa]